MHPLHPLFDLPARLAFRFSTSRRRFDRPLAAAVLAFLAPLAVLAAGCSKPDGAAPLLKPAAASASAATMASPPAGTIAPPFASGPAPLAASDGAPSANPAPPPPADSARKGTVVVHIGDSFTEASFEQNLRARVAGVGAKYLVKAVTPSYTPPWAYGGYDGVLDKLLDNRPKLVLITLGANEFDMPDPKLHARAVRDLAAKASKWGQCVWITPPRWKKDTGFLTVIGDNCAPCAFFDSDKYVHDVERQRDGIHPNEVGGARWATAFWNWLEAHRDVSKGAWALRADTPQEP